MQSRDRFFQVSAKGQQLLECAANGGFRVVLVKRLAPVLANNSEARPWSPQPRNRRGGNRRSSPQFASRLIDRGFHRVQVRVQHANERPSQRKIKSAERDQRRRIVKHIAGGILQQAPLFEQPVLPSCRAGCGSSSSVSRIWSSGSHHSSGDASACDQDRLQNARHVFQLDFFAV